MCEMCGDCCRDVTRNYWSDHGDYTPEQLKLLMGKRNKAKSGCEMLSQNKCRVQILLGYEIKPRVCKKYDCGDK
jgi:hypothetical protein